MISRRRGKRRGKEEKRKTEKEDEAEAGGGEKDVKEDRGGRHEQKFKNKQTNKNKKRLYTPSSHYPEKCICQCENACTV